MAEEELNYDNWEGSSYTIEVDLPADNGEKVVGSVVTRERPFILSQIKHAVISDDGDDPEQYSIAWSIQDYKKFYKGASAPMAKTFGSTHHGVWSPLLCPVKIDAKTTLYVELQNRYDPDGDAKKIQILFEGLEYIGE